MDKIVKFLNKLSKKDRAILSQILHDIHMLNLMNYDVKPLKGELKGLQRIRYKNIRIVFLVEKNESYIVNIDFRKDIYR
jgi:mRNA-degrading endonuclease RelE of RelBE toxin-antitoxin system